MGVTREVRNEDQLRTAFEFAKTEDPSVMIQRHAEGSEYRILIVADELIAMHERVPAMIAGDGVHSVAQLVEAENARRERLEQTGFADFSIKLEDDAQRCLATQGLTQDSVPPAGTDVRLATVPKVRNGGSIRIIKPDEVHPTVVEAAKRAVRMFRLDVGGVDYISTDCARAVSETGGIITEVNTFPQINAYDDFDVHAKFLSVLLPGVGRLPAILVIGSEEEGTALVRQLVSRSAAVGLTPGVIVETAAMCAELGASDVQAATFGNRLAVLGDDRIDCLIALQSAADIARRGLFLPAFDAAFICAGSKAQEAARVLGNPLLRPNIRGPVLAMAGSGSREAMDRTFGLDGFRAIASADECENVLADILARDHAG